MRLKYLTCNDKGRTRERSFFAIIPISLSGETRWLERVTVLEEVRKFYVFEGSDYYDWVKTEFVDK